MAEVFLPAQLSVLPDFAYHDDKTAPMGLNFVHTIDSKPLSTPWQVSEFRGSLLQGQPLPDGPILDCACGSGIQLSALGHVLQRPVYGIELDPERALASAKNIQTTHDFFHQQVQPWFSRSKVFVGDSTDANAICSVGSIEKQSIAMLYIDPARPRNSRTHGIEEMEPPLDRVLKAWQPYLALLDGFPALCFDLSPRLSAVQREEIEGIVLSCFSNIPMFWQWSSRGGGRTDRLMLWAGCIAQQGFSRRYIRYPPDQTAPFVITTEHRESHSNALAESLHVGMYISILDTALVECQLADEWLTSKFADEYRWIQPEGRRPMVCHTRSCVLDQREEFLIQSTGKIMAQYELAIEPSTVEEFARFANSHGFGKLTLRFEMDPEQQPVIQKTLDYALRPGPHSRTGFVVQHPNKLQYFLCSSETK
ncbi:MAG: class I SAM-dependent methyltransferase [archaeon]|nr:class I SAM-dependent methyltransferase [archaeon]MDA1167306.1 class I SAM-dependent methyltransferase [archaeon]